MSIPDLPLPTPGQTGWAVPLNESLELVNDALTEANVKLANLDTSVATAVSSSEIAATARDDAVQASDTAAQASVSAQQARDDAIDAAASISVGTPGGVAALDSAGKLVETQVPDWLSPAQVEQTISAEIIARVPHVNVKDYGAVGDGVVDDTAAIQAAINSGAPKVWLPRGTYRVSGTLIVPEGTSLIGDGIGVTEIVSTVTQNPVIQMSGSASPGSAIDVTADVPVGASTLTVASTEGITVGDYFVLSDDTIPEPNYPTRFSGELVRVVGVPSSTTVTLEKSNATGAGAVRGTFEGPGPVMGYTVARNARLIPVTLAEGGSFSGMTIRGRADAFGSNAGILLDYVRGAVVENVEIHTVGGSAISVRSSKNVLVDGSFIHDLPDDIANGRYGYGVNVGGACAMVIVANTQFERVRHGVTTNGFDFGIPYDVTVVNCRAYQTHNASFDTHGAGLNITFHGCVSTDSLYGFSVRAHAVSITSCEAIRPAYEGVAFWGNNRGAVIDQVIVRRAGRYGIDVGNGGVDITLRGVFIDGARSHGIRAVRDVIQGLRILGSTVHNCGMNGSADAVFVNSPAIDRLLIVGLVASSEGAPTALSRSAVAITSTGTPTRSAVSGVRGAGMGYASQELVKAPAGVVLEDNVALYTV